MEREDFVGGVNRQSQGLLIALSFVFIIQKINYNLDRTFKTQEGREREMKIETVRKEEEERE